MNRNDKFWSRLANTLLDFLPLRAYGALVLHSVTIAEQAAGAEIAFSTAPANK